jgi:hypothetical protein
LISFRMPWSTASHLWAYSSFLVFSCMIWVLSWVDRQGSTRNTPRLTLAVSEFLSARPASCLSVPSACSLEKTWLSTET